MTEQRRRIEASEIAYKGHFRPPPWEDGVRFGYGLGSLTYNPGGGTLFGTSHPKYNMVGELTIPAIGEVSTKLGDFFLPAGIVNTDAFAQKRMDLTGIAYCPPNDLWWCFASRYATAGLAASDEPTHGFHGPGGEVRGPWRLGPSPDHHQKFYSHYLEVAPVDWTGRPTLLCGKGDGAGNATVSHGPSFYSFSRVVGSEGYLPSKALVLYAVGHDLAGWNACDHHSDIAWIRDGARECLAVLVRKGMGEAVYRGGRGYVCPDGYTAQLYLYDPADLEASYNGEVEPWQVVPYARHDISEHFQQPTGSAGNTGEYMTGGMAWCADRGELILVEDFGEKPFLHVFGVENEKEHKEPVPELITVSLPGRMDEFFDDTPRGRLDAVAFIANREEEE